MEPPASSDPVKEACAPLADIDSEEEECHPVQQPQAHSIPHSSPPTGTAGVGPASHREEPLNEGSGEEEEVEHKAEKKHGESGQDSVECMDMKYGMESEAECDQYEFLSSIHTCYHSSFFLLRTPVTVGGKPVEIQLHKGIPGLTYYHSEQECRVSLSAMSRKVAAVLLKHGVYHVDTFYYEQVPLFSVVFSSKASLKRFLTAASGRVQRELESVIGEEFTKQLTRSNSQPSYFKVSINIESYLITPDRQEGTADAQLVTLANYSHYSSEWQNSRMFEFARIFQAQLQRGIQKSLSSQEVDCAELKDLVNELQSVTEWFRLGMNLDIPHVKLMQLHHDYKHIAECLLHMLMEWGKRERRTWSKVVRALAAIGRTLLAQELARKYGVDVPVEETALLPAATESSDNENADHQTVMVPTVQTADPEIEKQLKSKEEQLEASIASRCIIKQDISVNTKSLQQLQIQLRRVNKDRENIQVKLEKMKKQCEYFNRMKEQYRKMWIKSREDIDLLDEVIVEKEQEVKKLEGELEQKESEFQALKQKLSEVDEDLSQKTSKLQKKTDQVVELEKEVEQLNIKLSNKGKELDMEMQQITAKASSQAAYIGEMKLHVSSMREELVTKKKEFDDYKERMTDKEEKLRQLTETLHSQNIQKEKLERELKRDVDGAKSTTDAVQNLAKAEELVSILICVSNLTVELDDANREKHQMMLKSDIASQEIKRLQESVRKLKTKNPDPSNCRAVGAGLESAMKHKFSEFEVEVADVDGEPWTSNDGITITAEVTSIAHELTITGNVVSKTPAVYVVSYQPIKCGEHEISVKVNGTPINGSPFSLLVHNKPHPKKCKAIGEHVMNAEKNRAVKFVVQLADADGEPCATKQEVTVKLKALVDGSFANSSVMNKTPDTYEVSYQPINSGEHELSVKVNDMEINGSPFVLLVHNIPQPQNCKAFGKGIEEAENNEEARFTVQLADAEGDHCVTEQEVVVELKSLADGSLTKASVVRQTPATYEVAYQPSKSGEHRLIVKVNGMEINGSPFALLVRNIPDPQNCKAVGKGITKAEKHKTSEFMVQLADAEGYPCVTKQEVVVELKSLVDRSTTKANVVSQSPATYEVAYQPSKSGQHELSVKVNDNHIEGSPFALLIVNIPHIEKCKAIGEHVKNAEKNKVARFMVQLADEDDEPCATKQEVTVKLKALVDGSFANSSVMNKTPDTYEVSYQPINSGEHELSVKVNDMEINGSPFVLLVHNIPQPQNCKAFGKGIEEAENNEEARFTVQLADAEGDHCVTEQEVVVELKSLADGSLTKASVVSQTPATYEVAYQPSKSGEHEVIVKVNGMEINGSPFALLVRNIPDPQNCKAVGKGITKAEKHKTSEFMVQLADAEGYPCVTKQEVVVELKSLVDRSTTKANVVSQSPATYEVAYQPSKSGQHELSVKVNDNHIEGSPFALLIVNIPHIEKCKAIGEHVKNAEKNKVARFMVQLADEDDEPCATKQEVTVKLKALMNDFITEGSVVSKTPATYEASYQPRGSGEHELSVKVNDIHIEGSPFTLFVVNTPHTENCKAIGEHVRNAEKNKAAKFIVQLADEDGEPCATKQEVTVALKSRLTGSITEGSVVSITPATYEVSYQPRGIGRHKLSVKVNGMEIKGSPFPLLVYNIPYCPSCKVDGVVTNVKKKEVAKFTVNVVDAEGDACVTELDVVVELKSLVYGSITEADVMRISSAIFTVSYRPSKSGEHELTVKVNGVHINGSPFALLVHNIPDPHYCEAVGEGITRAEKHETLFIVHLADAEGYPCVTEQEVVVELMSLVDYSITKADVVSKTPATYEVAYQPSKIGEHELSVKVNGVHINGSPFALFVHNIPDPQNCEAVGEGITRAEKNETLFIVHLADSEGDPCVTEQEVVVELKSLVDGSITKADVVSQTPATYEVAYQPSKIGEHELSVKVNGVHINGSPFALFVFDTPDPQKCRAIGVVSNLKKHATVKFNVKLADAEGDPCVNKQTVTAQLISADDYHYSFNARVIWVSKNIYEVSYRPRKSAEYKLIVKVNGMEINSSPFDLLVYNIPRPRNCNVKIVSYVLPAVAPGIVKVFDSRQTYPPQQQPRTHHSIIVELADADGELCITTQKVAATMADKHSLHHCEVHSEDHATYRVDKPNCPIGRYILTAYVNGMAIGNPLRINLGDLNWH